MSLFNYSFSLFSTEFVFFTWLLIKIRHIAVKNRSVTQKAQRCCSVFDFQSNIMNLHNFWRQIHIEKLWNVDFCSNKQNFFNGLFRLKSMEMFGGNFRSINIHSADVWCIWLKCKQNKNQNEGKCVLKKLILDDIKIDYKIDHCKRRNYQRFWFYFWSK